MGGDVVKGLNDFFSTFFGMSIGAIFLLGVKRLFNIVYNLVNKKAKHEKEEREEMKQKLNMLELSMKSMAHDKIYKLTEEYINRGWVTLDELDNLNYLYTSYTALGGNGRGEKRYALVQALPVKKAGIQLVNSKEELDNYDYFKGGE